MAVKADAKQVVGFPLVPIGAAMTGQTAILRKLIGAGADIEARDRQSSSALDEAVAAAQVDSVLALLEAGADPNRPGRGGLPALHRAAMTGNTGAALALLSRGAAPNAIDAEKGNTALMLAANRGYLDLVQLLLAHGAKVDIVALDGWTALQAAEMIGDEETAALLRQAGARE